jgi:hypothetical protein
VLVCTSRADEIGGLVAMVVVVVVGSKYLSFDSGSVDPPQEGQVSSGVVLYDGLTIMSAYQACFVCRVKSDIREWCSLLLGMV